MAILVRSDKKGRPKMTKPLLGMLLVLLLGQVSSLRADNSQDSFYTMMSKREARYYLYTCKGWLWDLEDFNSEGIKINKYKDVNGNFSISNPDNDFASFKFSELKDPTIIAGATFGGDKFPSLYGVNLKDVQNLSHNSISDHKKGNCPLTYFPNSVLLSSSSCHSSIV